MSRLLEREELEEVASDVVFLPLKDQDIFKFVDD
jgi:hypothetical protein